MTTRRFPTLAATLAGLFVYSLLSVAPVFAQKADAPKADAAPAAAPKAEAPKADAPKTDAPALPAGTKALINLEYVAGGHERQKLDLYLPADAATGKPLPLVVWIHGGGWTAGNKDRPPALPFLNYGYAVASINYRYSTQAIFPAQIEDSKAAIRFLRANAKKYNLDADHIGVWGASAGGHLVALLGTTAGDKELEGTGGNLDQSSRVQCVVDWFGPADFSLFGPDSGAEGPITQLFGGPVAEHKELAAQASPVTHVSKDSAPFLIHHGDKDQLVPLQQSEVLEAALKKAGVEVTLVKVEGAAHGFGPKSHELGVQAKQFFDKYLKPAEK